MTEEDITLLHLPMDANGTFKADAVDNSATHNNQKKKKRNKLCDEKNRTVVHERRITFSRKSFRIPYLWKRRSLVYIIAILLLVLLVNLTINRDIDGREDDSLYYFNLHSHVPGMKDLPNSPQQKAFKNLTSLLKAQKASVTAQLKKQHAALTTKFGPANAQNKAKSDVKNNENFLKAKLLTETENKTSSLSLNSQLSTNSSHLHTATDFKILNAPLPLPSPPPPPTGYLVWSEFCKMPNLDPYLPEVMKNFRREKYKPCKLVPPLTKVEFNATTKRYTLFVDEEAIPAYSKTGKLDCCFQSIVRNGTAERADRDVSLSECMSFIDKTSISPLIDNILVRCRARNQQVYINGYPLMPERKEIRQRLELWKKYDDNQFYKKGRPPSVLMLGIDSISRVNLVRAMPKTAKYLFDNEWFEMSGFNKVQSLILVALTITGILSYSCIISVNDTFNYGSLFPTVFLQLYFMGTCDSAIPPYNDSLLHQVKTVLNPQDILIWDSVYLTVAVCWFFTSICLMTFLNQDQPRMVSGILWTWILVTFSICGMDLALGIIFGIDYSRFNRLAYMYNLDSIYAGEVRAEAAQLLAGMVVSLTMMIVALKGFILWIINFGFLVYLAMQASFIGQDKSGTNNLFMTRKDSDDILATRPPINAYQDEQKPSAFSTVFSNGGFEPDNQVRENAAVINREIIARAARLSTDISLHERRFRNLDNFQQYPPRSRPESTIHEHTDHQQQSTSPIVVTAFPAPDYTPPMQRAAQNPNRNQRFH